MAYLSHVEVHFVQDKDSILRFDVPLTVYPYQFETTVLRKNVSYISIENLDLGLNFCGEGTTYHTVEEEFLAYVTAMWRKASQTLHDTNHYRRMQRLTLLNRVKEMVGDSWTT